MRITFALQQLSKHYCILTVKTFPFLISFISHISTALRMSHFVLLVTKVSNCYLREITYCMT